MTILQMVERQFGQEALTKTAPKISKIASMVNTACRLAPGTPQGDGKVLMEWALGSLWWQLKHGFVTPKNMTIEWLDKDKKGEIGAVHVAIAQFEIMQYVLAQVQEKSLAFEEASDTLKHVWEMIRKCFLGWALFIDAFPQDAPAASSQGEDEGGADAPAASQGNCKEEYDPVAAKKKEHPSQLDHQILDFLYDLMSGSYKQFLQTTIQSHLKTHKDPKSLPKIQWHELKDLSAMREINRLLNLHGAIIEAKAGNGTAAPKDMVSWTGTAQDLAASQGDDVTKERDETWKQVRNLRRKFVHFGFVRNATASKQAMQQYFEKTPLYSWADGKPREAHRVFIFSADLWDESQTEPWCNHKDPASSQGEEILSWVCGMTGTSDVILLADGRAKKWRRVLEDKFLTARNCHETWVVYKPFKNIGSRKLAFGSDHKETLLVSLPVRRNHLRAAKRTQFTSAGETSTHDTSYTGVPPIQMASLPMVSRADKAKMTLAAPQGDEAAACQVPKQKHYDTSIGVPIFWQEKKTIELWTAVLEDLKCKAIFDCTPGSGVLARVALEQGYAYAALAKSQEHCAWLQQYLDRQTLRYMATPGCALFQKQLQPSIQLHFAHVIEQLRSQDEAVDDLEEVSDDEPTHSV